MNKISVQVITYRGGNSDIEEYPPLANISPAPNSAIDQTADEQSSVTLPGSDADSDGLLYIKSGSKEQRKTILLAGS